MRQARWLVLGVLTAPVFWYATLAMVAGTSCGAYDSGPDTDAQRAFCGDAAAGYAVQFHLVVVLPALPVLAGAVVAYLRARAMPFLIGVGAGVAVCLAVLAFVP